MQNKSIYDTPLLVPGVSEKEYTFTWSEALPIKIGYTFVGWTTVENGTTVSVKPEPVTNRCTYLATAADKTAVSVTLYPVWLPISYKIDYVLGGGLMLSPMTSYTTSYTIKDTVTFGVPVRDGYTFDGWTVERVGSGGWVAVRLDATLRTLPAGQWGNVKLVANWKPIPYTITYNTDGGDPIEKQTYTIDSLVPLATPTRTGYNFTGWTVSVEGFGKWSLTDIPAALNPMPAGQWGNVVLRANWTPVEYTILYDTAGGTAVAQTTYTIRDRVTIPATVRPGYTLLGWQVIPFVGEESNWQTSCAPNQTPLPGYWGNICMKAVWVENEVTFNYYVPDVGGKVESARQTVGVDTGKPSALPLPDAGYRFVGWYLDADYTLPVSAAEIDPLSGVLTPAKNQLTGLYSEKTYAYYAKFELILGRLTVAAANAAEDQALIFTVVGDPIAASLSPISLTVVIPADEQAVTITDLPIGTYLVSEQDGWSWRYDTVDSLPVVVRASTETEPMQIAAFTFPAECEKWLSACAYRKKED